MSIMPFGIFRDLSEVVEVEDLNKSNKLGQHTGKSLKFFEKNELDDDNFPIVHKSERFDKDHEYHHYNDVGMNHHLLVHKGLISHHLTTISVGASRGAADKVCAVASSGKSPVKMHELYHHLLKKGHILVGDEQSQGGIHVWSKLQKMPGVNIHGWDPKNKKPVNVDLKHGTDETHVTYKDLYANYDGNSTQGEAMHRDQAGMMLVAHHKDHKKK